MAATVRFVVSAKPAKRTLSQTQAYKVATIARIKLSAAADEADHNLRVCVGHANLLDSMSTASG